MALLFMAGFDTGATFAELGMSQVGSVAITASPYPRTGSYGLNMTQSTLGSAYVQRTLAASVAGCGAGVAFKPAGGWAAGTTRPLSFYDSGGVLQGYVAINGSNRLAIFRGDGTQLGADTTYTPGVGTYFQVECYYEPNDAGGRAIMWINGSGVAAVDYTGDTRNGGSANVQTVRINPGTVSGANHDAADDFYIYDTSGGMTYPQGDVAIYTMFPNGNGASSQFLGSDGNSTDNYLMVDENAPGHDSDTTYVQSATTGQKDTYAMSNPSVATGTVLGVKVAVNARKDVAGAGSLIIVTGLSGTEVDSATISMSTAYATYLTGIQATKPGGGAWSIADLTAMEAGVKVGA